MDAWMERGWCCHFCQRQLLYLVTVSLPRHWHHSAPCLLSESRPHPWFSCLTSVRVWDLCLEHYQFNVASSSESDIPSAVLHRCLPSPCNPTLHKHACSRRKHTLELSVISGSRMGLEFLFHFLVVSTRPLGKASSIPISNSTILTSAPSTSPLSVSST